MAWPQCIPSIRTSIPVFITNLPLPLLKPKHPRISTPYISIPLVNHQPIFFNLAPAPSTSTLSQPRDNPSNTYFATCPRGLGPYLAQELTNPFINAHVLSIHSSGVTFSSPISGHITAYRACLWLRTATRLLYQLHAQPVHNQGYALGTEVYQLCKRFINWEALLADGRSFAVQARVSHRTRISERGVATCVKDAICDSLTRRRHPPRSYDQADICVFVAIDDVIQIYLDMGGGTLHKRGYRNGIVHKAALNECVAAAMAYMAGFQPDGSFEGGEEEQTQIVLADPMCGSGTLLIEAGLLWLRVAVGLYRPQFGCERWVDYDENVMDDVRREAVQCQRKQIEESGLKLLGGDIHTGALRLAREGMHATRLNNMADLWYGDVNDVQPGDVDITICNPPWGMRLDTNRAWEGLGQFVRRGGEGVACVMSGVKGSDSRALRMKTKRKIPVRIGDVDARVLVYDVLPRR